MRTFASLLALGLVASAVACAETDDVASAESDVTNGWVTSEVTKRLRVSNPRDEGTLWSVSNGNLLADDAILQIPGGEWWGNASIPAGHGDGVLAQIEGVMTRAQTSLDVTSLWVPTGGFLDTMAKALGELDRRNAPANVRFLFGSYPGYEPDVREALADLTREVRPNTSLSVSVGIYWASPASWNHSKLIAADGREAIVGGMNLSDRHYLGTDPVHDVSLHIRGPATVTTQNYVNELWKDPCGSGRVASLRGTRCPAPFQMAASSSAPLGHVRMIPVGRTGRSFSNPSDTALVAMMDMTRNGGKIRISQQDIGSYKLLGGGSLPDAFLDAFTRAARRGIDVDIVLSNDGAYGGGTTDKDDAYFNDWDLEELWRGLVRRAAEMWPGQTANLCKHVHFARMRAGAAPTWASGMPYANHAKVVIVDDQAHYVGSQNLYSADLAELGVIVDDQPSTARFIADYWDKFASHSLKTAFVGRECR